MFTLEQLEAWDARACEKSLNFAGYGGSGDAFDFADQSYTVGQPSLTVAQFLQRPDLLQHRIQDISQKGFIVDALLSKNFQPKGGMIAYTRSDSLYLDRDPEEIPEGGYYPIAGDTFPTRLEERVRKYGLRTFITEETVDRSDFGVLEKELGKLRNTMVRYIDGLFMTKLVNDANIQTRAAAATWTRTVATIHEDIENSRSDIRNLYEGFEADTIVLHPSKLTPLITNTTFGTAYTGASAVQNPLFTGQLPPLFGLDIMWTPNLPDPNSALIIQKGVIGGIAEEKPLTVKALPFDENNDSFHIKTRRVVATFLDNPKAVVKLTGI